MKRFSLLEEPELRAAIRKLERQLSENVASISNPAQGSISYGTKAEARQTLRDLYNRLAEKTGQPVEYVMPKTHRQTARGTF